MKVISQRALRELLRNMHSKVTCVQRPALDDFERGAEDLPAIDLAESVPEKIPADVYQVIYQECGGFVECEANAQAIWTACRVAILRGLEDSDHEI